MASTSASDGQQEPKFKGGYDTKRFIDNDVFKFMKRDVTCSICTCVMADAVDACKHTFCIKCIERWAKRGPEGAFANCPTCRDPFVGRPLAGSAAVRTDSVRVVKGQLYIDLRKNVTIRQMVDKLPIQCQYQPWGCPQVMTVGEISAHEKHCQYNMCPKCTLMAINGYEEHVCLKEMQEKLAANDAEIDALRAAAHRKGRKRCRADDTEDPNQWIRFGFFTTDYVSHKEMTLNAGIELIGVGGVGDSRVNVSICWSHVDRLVISMKSKQSSKARVCVWPTPAGASYLRELLKRDSGMSIDLRSKDPIAKTVVFDIKDVSHQWINKLVTKCIEGSERTAELTFLRRSDTIALDMY